MINIENRHLYCRISKKEVSLSCLGFIFAALFVTIPYISDIFPIYRWVINYLLQPFFMGLVFLYCIIKKKKYTPKYLWLFGLLLGLCVIMLVTTIINKQNIILALLYTISILTIPLFFSVVGPNLFFSVLKGISAYFRIVLICWSLTIIIFRNNGLYHFGGGRNYYFWGNVNSSIKMAMPAVAIFSVIDIWKHKKILKTTWVITLFVLAAQFYIKSYVAAIGMVIYVGVLLLSLLKNGILNYIPRWTPWVLSLAILFCICLIQFSGTQQILNRVGLYFDRLGSITARIKMWEQGIKAIKGNLHGFGYLTDFSEFIRLGNYYPSTAHNLYIDITMQAGVFGVVVFIIFLYSSIKFMPDWNVWGVVPASLFAYAVMWNFEPYFLRPHFQCYLILLFIFLSLNLYQNENLKIRNN